MGSSGATTYRLAGLKRGGRAARDAAWGRHNRSIHRVRGRSTCLCSCLCSMFMFMFQFMSCHVRVHVHVHTRHQHGMRHVRNNRMRTPSILSPAGSTAAKASTSEIPESAMKPTSSLKTFIVAGLSRSRAAQTEKGEGCAGSGGQVAGAARRRDGDTNGACCRMSWLAQSLGRALAKMRRLAEKEAGIFGRGDEQSGRGGQRDWMRRPACMGPGRAGAAGAGEHAYSMDTLLGILSILLLEPCAF